MSSGQRRLRAKRPPPPPRLIEHAEFGGGPQVDLSGGADSAPLAVLRLGGRDLDEGLRAVDDGAQASAIVTGLSEASGTTARARRLTNESGIPWFCDPLLFRTALPGYRTAVRLQDLDYTPGRDAAPYTAAEFDDPDLTRRVARSVIGSQLDIGASGAWSGLFAVSNLQDPWLRVDTALARESAIARAELGLPPLWASLPVRLMGFGSLEEQRLLVRSLAANPPDAYVLQLDGLSEEASVERIVGALRLALLLQATGTPVVIARPGDLRRVFVAFGVRGVEFGLGRLVRFSVPDYRRRTGGPGPTPGPRFETPSLACSLPVLKAAAALRSSHLEENECNCPSCKRAGTLMDRLRRAPGHDAHVVCAEMAALAHVPIETRVQDLDRTLVAADREWRKLTMAGVDLGRPSRIERWRRVLEGGVAAGLLQPNRLARELRLFEP